jgi:uncharacterized protein YkwD
VAAGACASEATAPACSGVAVIDDSGWDVGWAALEDQMRVEINARRAQKATCGEEAMGPAAALALQVQARRAARHHSWDMETRDYFAHPSPEGCVVQDRMFAAGWQPELPWTVGENLAGGSETDAVDGLMASPPHCKNLMSPSFAYVGVGYAFRADASYGHYWTQVFGADGD